MSSNLVPDPSFEYDTLSAAPAGWTNNTPSLVTTFTVQNGWSSVGSKSVRITTGTMTAGQQPGLWVNGPIASIPSAGVPGFSVTPGQQFATRAAVNLLSVTGGGYWYLEAWYWNAAGTLVNANAYNFGSGVTPGIGTASGVFTIPATAAYLSLSMSVGASGTSGTVNMYMDAVALVSGVASVPDYFDGDTSGYHWNGPPGQSESVAGQSPSILVRSKPPLRLQTNITTPSGKHYRWATDEPKAENVPSGLTLSSTMPGGYENFSSTLPRKPDLSYSDLAEFSDVTVRGVGGSIAWQGRLETSPRTSGDSMAITPGAVGYQAKLSDSAAAREIYVSIDLAAWGPASLARQIAIGTTMEQPIGVVPDQTSGKPAFILQLTGAWANWRWCEGWFDGKGIPIGRIYYAWQSGAAVTTATDSNWQVGLGIDSDDQATTGTGGNFGLVGGTGTGAVVNTSSNWPWGVVWFGYNQTGGAEGTSYQWRWTQLAVYGQHGLTLRGTNTATSAQGVLASDVVAHAVNKYAPGLSITDAGGNSTIETSQFVIPHLVFTDQTTTADIVTQSTRFELLDWYVYDSGGKPTFYLASRQNHGKFWKARVGPSQLTHTGPDASRIWNGAIVQYTDTTGASRTVGPPGSNCDTTSTLLYDDDPQNPATAASLTRTAPPIAMGTSTAAGAISIGQRFLYESKLLDHSGEAQLVAYVQDARSQWWPAWMVKAGDQIQFVDGADTSWRRVVKAEYSDDTKTTRISLDAPAAGLQALLERLGVKLVALQL